MASKIMGAPKRAARSTSRRDNVTETFSREKTQNQSKTPSQIKKAQTKRKKGTKRTKRDKAVAEMEKKKKEKEKRRLAKLNREKLQPGETVVGAAAIWKVSTILGSGGFGDVFKVTCMSKKPRGASKLKPRATSTTTTNENTGAEKKEDDENTVMTVAKKATSVDAPSIVFVGGDVIEGNEYAMKTELQTSGDQHMLRLKVEMMVLQHCTNVRNPAKKSHFLELLDRGRTSKFKYIVMTMVGPSLQDIRKHYLENPREFSGETAMVISQQTLESLQDLHELGFLHRDIKPHNFAVGLAEKEKQVYMLDFGIAKRHIINGEVKKPRVCVKFLGTLRFASRASHTCVEQGRKDDLETWIYLVYDAFDSEGLVWRREEDAKKIFAQKDRFFKNPVKNPRMPAGFEAILAHTNKLGYYDKPDYAFIQQKLAEIAKNANYKLENYTPDWVGKKKREDDRGGLKLDQTQVATNEAAEKSSTDENENNNNDSKMKCGF